MTDLSKMPEGAKPASVSHIPSLKEQRNDLLLALEQIAAGLASDPPKMSRSVAAHIARAAIAKATGGNND